MYSFGQIRTDPVVPEPIAAPEPTPGADLSSAFAAGALAGFVGGFVVGGLIAGITAYVVTR